MQREERPFYVIERRPEHMSEKLDVYLQALKCQGIEINKKYMEDLLYLFTPPTYIASGLRHQIVFGYFGYNIDDVPVDKDMTKILSFMCAIFLMHCTHARSLDDDTAPLLRGYLNMCEAWFEKNRQLFLTSEFPEQIDESMTGLEEFYRENAEKYGI